MDTENLLKSLNAHDVDYVVIGATAFPVHGYSRATLDIDIFIRPTEENCQFVKGITFDEVWKNKVAAKLGETPAYFASLDDLIKMKQAAGREKDKEDLRVLEKLKEKIST